MLKESAIYRKFKIYEDDETGEFCFKPICQNCGKEIDRKYRAKTKEDVKTMINDGMWACSYACFGWLTKKEFPQHFAYLKAKYGTDNPYTIGKVFHQLLEYCKANYIKDEKGE